MRKVYLIGFLFAVPLFADTTYVDWLNLTLKATISLKDDGLLSRSDVGRKFLNLLKDTYYDANQKVGDFLRYDFQKEAQLIPYLQDYRRIDERYLTDGTKEIDYEIPLSQRILGLILPKSESVKLVVPMCCPTCGQIWPQERRIPEGLTLIPKEENIVSNYTSIVIDCRNLGLNPALFPKVKNDRGDDVYSLAFAQSEYVSENGLVLFVKDIQDIYTNSRVGYNPLRISAIGVGGKNKTDPTISQFDAVKIHGSKNGLELLAKCRIAFVLGH